ncbi:hypothetical protein VdG1_02967 [Verticillium dahliae VDG1]|nr:hypothetical protein VdG1_02967 [Verticillium dahliae VDG1]
MASCRTPALRNLLTSSTRTLRAANQRRWAQVHDVRFLATTQPRRALADKYREKLSQKARLEGHQSRFYGGWDLDGKGGEPDPQRLERAVERRRLLEWFAAADPRFSVEKLLEEAERMG